MSMPTSLPRHACVEAGLPKAMPQQCREYACDVHSRLLAHLNALRIEQELMAHAAPWSAFRRSVSEGAALIPTEVVQLYMPPRRTRTVPQ